MFNTTVVIDPKKVLEIIKDVEHDTAVTVIEMIRQECGPDSIPDFVLQKVAARFSINWHTLRMII